MPDNGNKTRPVRTLTVKNFSVIKEAKLELRKITVLIGPQSSGKSLLCKLVQFLGREVPDLAIERVAARYSFPEFRESIEKEFESWFPSMGWGKPGWSMNFTMGQFSIDVSTQLQTDESMHASITFSEVFKEAYESRLLETANEQQRHGFMPPLDVLRSLAATSFRRLQGRGVWDVSTYIPLERSYFVDTQKGYRALGTDPDPISKRFAVVFANSLSPGFSKPRLTRFLGGDLIQGPNGPSVAFEDGRILALNYLSSGGKETLPILSVLDYYEHQRRQTGGRLPNEELYGDRLYFFDDFTIEEPEASVFPRTQYELVQELSSLANEVDFVPHFTITTHSPYILSVFGDLVKAGKVGAESAVHHGAVANVIPERYWVAPNEFAAYKIENGKLESIFDEKTGQIDGDYLDDVSGKISDELGQLLEIQYGK
jgi:hypothetical protein